jgi:hypothetical protein
VHVPAFCDTCGAVFNSGIVAENAKSITLVGNRAGPCPVCGGMGHIPDGVFNFVGNTIEILSAPQRSVDELTRLAKILRDAREKKETPEAVAQKIREELPALSGLADLLPRTRAELYAFLALIVAVITLISQSGGSENKSTNVTVNQTINQVFIETEKTAKPPQQQEQSPKKVGRNEPCPCGSGKKYKKCCGKLQ